MGAWFPSPSRIELDVSMDANPYIHTTSKRPEKVCMVVQYSNLPKFRSILRCWEKVMFPSPPFPAFLPNPLKNITSTSLNHAIGIPQGSMYGIFTYMYHKNQPCHLGIIYHPSRSKIRGDFLAGFPDMFHHHLGWFPTGGGCHDGLVPSVV